MAFRDAIAPPSWRALCCLLLLCLGGNARAGDAELDQVTAEGRADERRDASPRDPSGFATEVRRRDATSTAAELVRAAPGVSVRDHGLNQSATLSVRGSSSDQVVVLLDGLPMNSAAGGGTDLSLLPAPFIERLRVSRGAAGARFGAGALGGALEIETVSPGDAARPLFGALSYGSFNTAELSLGTAQQFGPLSALVLAFARGSTGDFPFLYDDRPQLDGNPLVWRNRENNDARRTGALGKLGWESGATRADLMLEAGQGERGLPGTAQAPTFGTRQRDARLSAIARVTRLVGPGELELRAGGRLGELALNFAHADPLAAQRDARGFGEAAWRMLLGRHAIELGANAGVERLQSPLHGEHSRPLLALFAADELTLPWLTLLPAVRLDKIGDFTGLSPKLGLLAPLGPHLRAKANVGRSFRAPSFGELYLEQGSLMPNPDLKAERASFADAGLVANLGGVQGSAAAFFTLYDDLILYEMYAPFRAKPFNFGKAWVYGAELEATFSRSVGGGFVEAGAGYTLAISANRRDIERYFDKELPNHPRHRFNGRFGAGMGRLSGHLAADAQTRLFLNRSNTDSLAGRARFDAGLSFLVDKADGVSVTAEVRNALDAMSEDLYGHPLPGRAYFISLRAGFAASSPSHASANTGTSPRISAP